MKKSKKLYVAMGIMLSGKLNNEGAQDELCTVLIYPTTLEDVNEQLEQKFQHYDAFKPMFMGGIYEAKLFRAYI